MDKNMENGQKITVILERYFGQTIGKMDCQKLIYLMQNKFLKHLYFYLSNIKNVCKEIKIYKNIIKIRFKI